MASDNRVTPPAIRAASGFASFLDKENVDGGAYHARTSDYGVVAGSTTDDFVARKKCRLEAMPTEPVRPVDVFRDGGVKPDERRDLEYKSGNMMTLDTERVLTPRDFEPDVTGSNSAMRRMEAAEIKRNAVNTKDLEAWAHDYFMDTCFQLISRVSVELGIVYLSDFVRNYVDRPPSHALATQMVLLQQHADSCLRKILGSLGSDPTSGKTTGAWYVDLVGVIELIIEEERTPASRVSALGVAVNRLALHFAKKACGGTYPTADKLAKTGVYFRRVIAETLVLADRISCYDKYYSNVKPVSKVRAVQEQDEASYLFSLRSALDSTDSDTEDVVVS